jgi:hypothetical protein
VQLIVLELSALDVFRLLWKLPKRNEGCFSAGADLTSEICEKDARRRENRFEERAMRVQPALADRVKRVLLCVNGDRQLQVVMSARQLLKCDGSRMKTAELTAFFSSLRVAFAAFSATAARAFSSGSARARRGLFATPSAGTVDATLSAVESESPRFRPFRAAPGAGSVAS